MLFMNEYEVREAEARWKDHPVLGPAACTLHNLMLWTNANSDGWAYWPKPLRAAKSLMTLIEQGNRWQRERYQRPQTPEPTETEYKAALRSVKAFRTKQGGTFDIVDIREGKQVTV